MYRALLMLFVIIVLLVIFLKINDTVTFSAGDIYSDNPRINITAPSEVKVISTRVKEGYEVKKGDTLLVLENKKVISDFNVSNLEIETLSAKIPIIESLIQKSQEEKKSYQNLLEIQSNIYNTNISNAKQEINSLTEKMELSQQQTYLISDRYKNDSLLFVKGAISRLELEEQKNKSIEDKKEVSDLNSLYKGKRFELKNLSSKNNESKNNLYRNIIEIENQITQYQKEILDLKSDVENKKYNLNHISEEFNRLMVISPINGTISNLFNTRQNSEIILKDDLLITVSPRKENYYAKIILPEKDLTYVKNGQIVNLKIDAYNYYKFGPVKGNIHYVSPSDIDGNFYCLVNLISYNGNIKLKAGYSFKGKIILEEMRLYQYIFKNLFNKLDDGINQ
jgi:multidrug resistance efflux pump